MALDAEALHKCSCEVCGNGIEVPISAVSDYIHCPHCGKPTRWVSSTPAPAGFSISDVSAEWSCAFSGAVPRPKATVLYRLSLLMAAVLVVLLPFCYFAMI